MGFLPKKKNWNPGHFIFRIKEKTESGGVRYSKSKKTRILGVSCSNQTKKTESCLFPIEKKMKKKQNLGEFPQNKRKTTES